MAATGITQIFAGNGIGTSKPVSPGPAPGVAPAGTTADFRTQLAAASEPGAPDAGGSGTAYRQFEAMVISQFVSTMLNAGGQSLFGEGTAMSSYTSIFAQAIGEQVAEHGGIGLADAIAAARSGSSGPAVGDVPALEVPNG